jgi:hypothetical protein
MQQQVQINQRAKDVVSEAAAFFTKRRAKITDRSERGFRFGLDGSDEQDGGRVTVASGAGNSSTVTVQADGLGVLAIAESFVRELRKQARGAGRQAKAPAGGLRGGFGELRERLGMPEVTAVETPAARPDGPVPNEAPTVSGEAGPRSAPARLAPVAADHPAFTGPDVEVRNPAAAPPVNEGLAAPPSAEQTGGVPQPGEVQVERPVDSAAPAAGQTGQRREQDA